MSTKEVIPNKNLTINDELCTESQQEVLERRIFGLALALATEPSKLAHLWQMLVRLQEQRALPPDFCTWALGQLDERVMASALGYAHDAEALMQLLSFKGGTFASLLQDIEDLYQHQQLSQPVYARAKLLLRANTPPRPE